MRLLPWRTRDPDDEQLAEDEKRLAEVRNQWPEVRDAVGQMTEHRRRNHFAESIATIYRGRP